MSKLNQNLINDLYKLLDTTEAKQTLNKIDSTKSADQLVHNLYIANTSAQITDACQAIATVLTKTYKVSQGSLDRNPMLKAGLITPLINVTNAGLQEFREQMAANPELIKESSKLTSIFELPYILAKFYSVNDQVEEFKTWLNIAKNFKREANLDGTLIDAELHEFEASEISRRLTQNNPHGTLDESINLFLKSLAINKNNGVTLDGENAELRHAQNSLCIAMSKKMLASIEQAQTVNTDLINSIAEQSQQVNGLLDEIEPVFLKTNDKKRMGNLLATRGLVGLLEALVNNKSDAELAKIESIFERSLESMPKGVVPQYANLMNRYANYCVARAAHIYNQTNETAKLAAISSHPYAKLANKCFTHNNEENANLAEAERLMAKAADLYAESFNSTQGNAGEKYGQEAQKLRKLLHNEEAMEIIKGNDVQKTETSEDKVTNSSAPSMKLALG